MSKSFSTQFTRAATVTGVIGVLALGVAAGGARAASAGAQTKVPPIHERFTHQTCPSKPTTTVQLDACAADAVLVLDQTIDRLDTSIMAELPATGQKQFISAIREWLIYRSEVAQAAGSPSSGGTIEPLVELGALRDEDQAHITALTREFASESGQKP